MNPTMQQINLYQQGKEQLGAFTTRTSLMTLGIMAVALVAVWAFGLWEVRTMERNLASMSELQSSQEALLMTTGGDTVSTDPGILHEQLRQAQNLANLRKRTLGVLQSRLATNATGFTPRLEALARRHLQGVWLDHILLTNSRGVSSIGGGTVSVDLIPRYLQGLTHEASLTGTAFNEFRIEGRYANQDEDDTPAIRTGSYRFSATNQSGVETIDVAATESGNALQTG